MKYGEEERESETSGMSCRQMGKRTEGGTVTEKKTQRHKHTHCTHRFRLALK